MIAPTWLVSANPSPTPIAAQSAPPRSVGTRSDAASPPSYGIPRAAEPDPPDDDRGDGGDGP